MRLQITIEAGHGDDFFEVLWTFKFQPSLYSRYIKYRLEVQKEVFRKMLWRVADFSGVEVLTYCIMDNHFHVLVRVPEKDRTLSPCAQAGLRESPLENKSDFPLKRVIRTS